MAQMIDIVATQHTHRVFRFLQHNSFRENNATEISAEIFAEGKWA